MWDLSSPTRDQTCISCIARQILNHWTTREVPILLKPHFRPLIEILLHMFDIIIFLKRRCGSVIVSYPSYTASLTTGQDLSTPVWHTGLCMSWHLPQSYAPLPLLVCTLPSSLIQLVIHSHTYCVLSGLCVFAAALLFLWKSFPHSELRGLDKCRLSFKINLRYSLIQATFYCWLSFLYTIIISLSLLFWRLFFFCIYVFFSMGCKHLKARSVSHILISSSNHHDWHTAGIKK